jgi:hypothetical protein
VLGVKQVKLAVVGVTVIVGVVLFSVITTLAEAVQPLAVDVPITVNVPTIVIFAMAVVAVNPPPAFVHEYVSAPPAVMVVLGVKQVKIAVVGVTVMVGVVLFSVITTLAEAVQPLTVEVPITVYVPIILILAAAVAAVNPPPAFVHE